MSYQSEQRWNFPRFSSLCFTAVAVVNQPDQKLVMYIFLNCRKWVNSLARSIKIFYPSPETWKKTSLNWKNIQLVSNWKKIQFIKLDISNWRIGRIWFRMIGDMNNKQDWSKHDCDSRIELFWKWIIDYCKFNLKQNTRINWHWKLQKWKATCFIQGRAWIETVLYIWRYLLSRVRVIICNDKKIKKGTDVAFGSALIQALPLQWTMSEMVKYRAALCSFSNFTALVFYHVWHSLVEWFTPFISCP